MSTASSIEQDRQEYRRLRASTTRVSAQEFDALAWGIAHEMADGEDVTPYYWVYAAELVAAGHDHA